jgi:hypothetical protein
MSYNSNESAKQNWINTETARILLDYDLDFTIEKLPLFGYRVIPEIAGIIDEQKVAIESEYFGLFNSKSGEIIHTVKGGYTVTQNAEIIALVLEGMEAFGDSLRVVKAGALKGGRRVFIQLEVNNGANVKGDKITQYVTIIDSNDGSTGLSVGIGDRTASCMNQFFTFYKSAQTKFRHTNSLTEKISAIPSLIEEALFKSEKQIETYNKMADVPVDAKDVALMIERVLGTSPEMLNEETSTRTRNQVEALGNHIRKEIADKGMNVWGLHSGVTSFTTHEGNTSDDTKNMEQMLTGAKYTKNQKSFNYALQMV